MKNHETRQPSDEEIMVAHKAKMKNYRYRYFELYIWILMPFVPLLWQIMKNSGKSITYQESILSNYYIVILSFFLAMFPILFKLIFNNYPLEYLRKYVSRHNPLFEEGEEGYEDSDDDSTDIEPDKIISEIRILSLDTAITESTDIAERIYKRAGVYILVGVLIAFAGIALFYSPIFPITESNDVTLRFFSYLPRFSALFFVEFIAIYFLKQNRIMLEEYRYFERIKRKRQDQYAFIKLLDHYKDNPEMTKIIVEKGMIAPDTMMTNSETTEILETQKIVNQDMDILSKVTDILRISKQK